MKKLSILLTAIVIALLHTHCAFATIGQWTYSANGTNFVTNDSRYIPSSGGMVHVGYNYNPMMLTVEGDATIFTTDASGTIVWTTTLQGDHDGQFKQVQIAANGDYLAVGYTGRIAPGSGSQNLHALIARFSPSGALLWHREIIDANPNPGSMGDVYFAVHEMPDHLHIAVAGSTDYQGNGVADALIAYFDNNGIQIWSKKFTNNNNTDHFYGVTELNGEIVACGTTNGSGQSHHSGVITRVTTAGAHIASYKYDITYNQALAGTAMSTVWFLDIMKRNGQLTINGSISNNYTASLGNVQIVLDINPSTFAASGHVIDNSPLPYSGNVKMYPVGANDYIVVQNPGNVVFNPIGGNATNDFVLSRVTGGSAVFSKRITGSPKAVYGLDFKSPNIYMGGSREDFSGAGSPIGAYQAITDMIFTPNADCETVDDAPIITPHLITPTNWVWDGPAIQFPNDEVLVPASMQPTGTKLCGTAPPQPTDSCKGCDLQCYWRTTGNNAINSSNFLGTINSSELRFRTVNVERGLFDTDGDFGINLGGGLPTAKLHVDCAAPKQGPSNVRFENLTLAPEKLPILVIDKNGYVYQTKGDVAGRAANTDDQIQKLEEQLQALQQQVNTLQTMLGQHTDYSSDGLKIFPNPTDGDITVSYNLPQMKQPGEVVLTDVAGQRLLSQPITAVTGEVKITIPGNVVSGTVYCNVVCNGQILATRKITLNRK